MVLKLMVEKPSHDGPHTMTFAASTDNPHELLQFVLQNVRLEDITSVEISVKTATPITLEDGDLSEVQLEEEPEEPTEPEEPEPEPEPEPVDEDIVRFQEDSDAYRIAAMMADRDEQWLELGEVRQFTPDEYKIPDGRFSQILWDLTNRGLADQKDHPHDGRKRLYKLTDRGKRSVERFAES